MRAAKTAARTKRTVLSKRLATCATEATMRAERGTLSKRLAIRTGKGASRKYLAARSVGPLAWMCA